MSLAGGQVDAGSAHNRLPGAGYVDGKFRYELSADLVTLSDARATEAEAIRTVRTHIMAQHIGDGRRGLSVCAPTSDLGCTFMAANLAVALSQVGVATLLIDANLRAPGVQSFIGPSALTAGLTECLIAGDNRGGDYIHHEILPNLSVMYAGGMADNPQELLGSEAFRGLIERCLRDFEFTIIDTPPSNGVADALRISSVIGYALVVAKANVSRSSDIVALAKQLRDDGAEVVGAVLTEI